MTFSSKPYLDINDINATVEAVRKEPALGKVTFNMRGKSLGGVALETATGALTQNGAADKSRGGKFTLVSDEPVSLLGTDRGVSPAEYALQALGGCYAVTLTSLAASRGIQLDEIRLDLNFDIDLNGFLGIDESVRKGAQGIRVDVQLESENASREQLDELVKALPSHSPLHDTFANPVNVTARLI